MMKTSDGVELKVGMQVRATTAGMQKAYAALTGLTFAQMHTAALAQGATKAQADAAEADMLAEFKKLPPMTVTALQEPSKVTLLANGSTTTMDASDLVSLSPSSVKPTVSTGSWLTKKVVGPVPVWGVGLGAAGLLATAIYFWRK